jgi:hypothetical protein
MIVGFFFIRPIPLPQEKLEGVEEGILTTLLHQPDHATETHLLDHGVIESSSTSLTVQEVDLLPNLYGKHLFKSLDFWLLCSILSIRKPYSFPRMPILICAVSGTGLMCQSLSTIHFFSNLKRITRH